MSTENKPESHKEGKEKKSINNPVHHIKVLKERLIEAEKQYQEQTAELQSLRDQLAAKDEECSHLAACQCDSPASDEGGNFYCIKVKSLEEENLKLQEALKELIPLATLTTGKKNEQMLIVDRAKSLLTQKIK